MNQYFLSTAAEKDLNGIVGHLALKSLSAAVTLLDSLRQKCRLIAENPSIGRSRTELSPGLRGFSAGNIIVIYRVLEEEVEIVRFISRFRDLDSVLHWH